MIPQDRTDYSLQKSGQIPMSTLSGAWAMTRAVGHLRHRGFLRNAQFPAQRVRGDLLRLYRLFRTMLRDSRQSLS